MIQFNRILQPRLVQPLVRLFGMKVGGSPAPTLAPEVAPQVDVNQQDDPTIFWLRQERILAAQASLGAGGAGVFTAFMVRNPAGSGSLVTIEEYAAQAGVDWLAATISANADYTTGISAAPRDSRWISVGGYTGSAKVSAQTNLVASPAGFTHARVLAAQWARVSVPIVLSPGWGFVMYPAVANNALSGIYVAWRERLLPDEETATG